MRTIQFFLQCASCVCRYRIIVRIEITTHRIFSLIFLEVNTHFSNTINVIIVIKYSAITLAYSSGQRSAPLLPIIQTLTGVVSIYNFLAFHVRTLLHELHFERKPTSYTHNSTLHRITRSPLVPATNKISIYHDMLFPQKAHIKTITQQALFRLSKPVGKYSSNLVIIFGNM